MKTTRIIAIGAIAASLGLFSAEYSAQAKSLRDAEIPAEFPPASFKGKQYVDSRGCVYIRAGIDGLVNWVPRVSRSREVLCGYQPTFAKAQPAPAPAAKPAANVEVITPAATPEPAPEVKPKAKPATTTPPPAAKPAPRKVVTTKAKPVRQAPAVKKTPRKVAKAAPATVTPRQVAKAKPANPVIVGLPPKVQVKTRASTAQQPAMVTSCDGVSSVSSRYSGSRREGEPVRCGPQAEPYVTVIRREPVTVMRGGKKVTLQRRVVRQQTATTRRVAPATTRVVPRHVWKQQQADQVDAPIPEGYRAAWSDDRLNKKRAHQTLDGVDATDLAWTRTVPRRLYLKSSGLVVTHQYPGLEYPYHSYAEMRAAGLDTITGTAVVKNTRRKAPALVSTKSVTPRATATKPSNTRAKPTAATPKAATKGRFVQLGTYSVPANADKAAARARAKGLPVRLGTLKKGGKSYRIVLAGPYGANQAGAALSQARRAGYSDAFLR